MQNQLHFTFLWGFVVTFWMTRAPKSVLQLLGFGTETDRAWLVSLVCRWGKLSFFCLMNAVLLSLIPDNMSREFPGASVIALAAATAISALVLRKPRKD